MICKEYLKAVLNKNVKNGIVKKYQFKTTKQDGENIDDFYRGVEQLIISELKEKKLIIIDIYEKDKYVYEVLTKEEQNE